MFFALADTAAAHQRIQKEFVDAGIEWRKLKPLIEMTEHRIVWRALDVKCSSIAAWMPRRRRRCAVSQP